MFNSQEFLLLLRMLPFIVMLLHWVQVRLGIAVVILGRVCNYRVEQVRLVSFLGFALFQVRWLFVLFFMCRLLRRSRGSEKFVCYPYRHFRFPY